MKTLLDAANTIDTANVLKPEFLAAVAADLRKGDVNILSISRIEGAANALAAAARAVRAILVAEQSAS